MVKENGIPVADYWYDGLGNRVRSLENGEEIYYIYNGLNIIQEHNVTANSRTDYIFAGIRRIAEKTDSVVRYYHTDHLGSTSLMTDSQGSIVAEYKYYPYGASLAQSILDPGFDGATYRFTGKGDSPNTGLYYFGARFYDPEVGRFITLDPARDGLNWYEYCGSNPLVYVDPDGQEALSFATTAVVTAVGLGALVVAVDLYLMTPEGQRVLNEMATSLGYAADQIGRTINETTQLVISYVSAQLESYSDKMDTREHTVYVMVDESKKVHYVGRTNNFKRRQREHSEILGKNNWTMEPVMTGLAKDQARGVEQMLVSAYTLDALINARREISKCKVDRFAAETTRALKIMGSIPNNEWLDLVGR